MLALYSILFKASYLLSLYFWLYTNTSLLASKFQPIIFFLACTSALCATWQHDNYQKNKKKKARRDTTKQPKHLQHNPFWNIFRMFLFKHGNNRNNKGKTFFLLNFSKELYSHSALCCWALTHTEKCVWTSKRSSTYSAPVQLCTNEKTTCVWARAWLRMLQKGVTVTDTPLFLK